MKTELDKQKIVKKTNKNRLSYKKFLNQIKKDGNENNIE